MIPGIKMTDLDERKANLLHLTVRRHVETAEPVGSSWLAERLGVSSATVRNELAELENAGYVAQPHTSAGRIPTETGYRYYVERFMEPTDASKEAAETFREAVADAEEEAYRLRGVAKALAELAKETALVGFGPRDVYYTGISNLFGKPEFRMAGYVTTMSKVLDHLDEIMERIYPEVPQEIEVRIGRENPFGNDCAVLFTRIPQLSSRNPDPSVGISGTQDSPLIALLGPMRMDYDACYGLLDSAVRTLKET